MSDFKLDWEEHRGLCRYVARIAVRLDTRLKPHFQEIICDLESKLWQICEGCTYDPEKSRPSTYLTTALLKHCERAIRRQYIGSHVTWKSLSDVSFYNINEIGYATIHNEQAAKEQDEREVRELARELLNSIGGQTAEHLERNQIKGQSWRDIAKADGISKAVSDKNKRTVARFVRNLKEHNPQKYNDCIEALGRKAV